MAGDITKDEADKAMRVLEGAGATGSARVFLAYTLQPLRLAEVASRKPEYAKELLGALTAKGVAPDYSKERKILDDRTSYLEDLRKKYEQMEADLKGRETVYAASMESLEKKEAALAAKEKDLMTRETNLTVGKADLQKQIREIEEARKKRKEEDAAAAKRADEVLKGLLEIDGKIPDGKG